MQIAGCSSTRSTGGTKRFKGVGVCRVIPRVLELIQAAHTACFLGSTRCLPEVAQASDHRMERKDKHCPRETSLKTGFRAERGVKGNPPMFCEVRDSEKGWTRRYHHETRTGHWKINSSGQCLSSACVWVNTRPLFHW